jgi:hypothetical protein
MAATSFAIKNDPARLVAGAGNFRLGTLGYCADSGITLPPHMQDSITLARQKKSGSAHSIERLLVGTRRELLQGDCTRIDDMEARHVLGFRGVAGLKSLDEGIDLGEAVWQPLGMHQGCRTQQVDPGVESAKDLADEIVSAIAEHDIV